jgi:hypothetical protein
MNQPGAGDRAAIRGPRTPARAGERTAIRDRASGAGNNAGKLPFAAGLPS